LRLDGHQRPMRQAKRVKYLPAGWERVESSSEPGRFYFCNAATGESTWQLPPDDPAATTDAEHSATPSAFRIGSSVMLEPPRSASSHVALRGTRAIVMACSDDFAEVALTFDERAQRERVPISWLKRVTSGGAKLLLHSNDTRVGSLEDTLHAAPQHRAPVFQRRYCWDEAQWQALWRDLARAAHNPDPMAQHHVGRILVSPRPAGDRLVLDGQQRLTTCSVLLASLRDRCLVLGDEEEAGKLAALVRDPSSGSPKMMPTLDDRADYERAIAGRSPGDCVTEAGADCEAPLARARATFNRLCEDLQDAPSARRVARAARERLKCTVWVLADADLTVVFENLSLKGRPQLGGPRENDDAEVLGVLMSSVDLVRNFVLEHFGPEEESMRAVHAEYWSLLEARAVARAGAGVPVSEAVSTALLDFLRERGLDPTYRLYGAFLSWWRTAAPDGVVDGAAARDRLQELARNVAAPEAACIEPRAKEASVTESAAAPGQRSSSGKQGRHASRCCGL